MATDRFLAALSIYVVVPTVVVRSSPFLSNPIGVVQFNSGSYPSASTVWPFVVTHGSLHRRHMAGTVMEPRGVG